MQYEIHIARVEKHELPAATAVLAAAMVSNPVNSAVLRSSDARARVQLQRLFAKVLDRPACQLLAARVDGKIAGVMNFVRSPACQFSTVQKLAMLPELVLIFGTLLPRVLKWTGNWERHDPWEPHWHLGPLAVAPDMQGRGIGTALLRHFCNAVDERKEAAYLETDKSENVRLYERFGFTVRAEDEVYGVKNWFMFRSAAL